jgi:hypothetical protein
MANEPGNGISREEIAIAMASLGRDPSAKAVNDIFAHVSGMAPDQADRETAVRIAVETAMSLHKSGTFVRYHATRDQGVWERETFEIDVPVDVPEDERQDHVIARMEDAVSDSAPQILNNVEGMDIVIEIKEIGVVHAAGNSPNPISKQRSTPEDLTIAFLGIGVELALASSPGPVDLDPFEGRVGFVQAVIEHALLLDRVADWFDEREGHPGVFSYDVAESFGVEYARLLVGSKSRDVDPATVLRDVMITAGYDAADVDAAMALPLRPTLKAVPPIADVRASLGGDVRDKASASFKVDMELRFGSDAALGVWFRTEEDGSALTLAQHDALYEKLGRDRMPAVESLFPDGHSAITCTHYAAQIFKGMEPGRAQIWGFANDDNPQSRVAREEIHPGGHDFAVVDDRYLVDPWIRLVASASDQIVYDLKNTADAALALDIYGPRENWGRLVAAEQSAEIERVLTRKDVLDVMQECLRIRRREHPGWKGDAVANAEAFLFQIAREAPLRAEVVANALRSEPDLFSNELGISPEKVRLYANQLRQGVSAEGAAKLRTLNAQLEKSAASEVEDSSPSM